MCVNKKLVLFGAGKIGRSFIGQLFSRGGYEVVFVDIFKPVIDELNVRKNYNVIIKSEKEEIINIKNVRGILVTDEQSVINEIATCDLVAVSIGQNGLPAIMPLIAKGLLARYIHKQSSPLDIIIAENLRNAASYFKNELSKYLPEIFPFNDLVGLIETSIGKMVPIMTQKDMEADILQVFAEPYNTLILDKSGFKNPIPQIDGLSPKENMKAWVDRKLFIHNLGHAATAYIGYYYNPSLKYIYEVLDIPEIYSQVREVMLQAAEIIICKYPDVFDTYDLTRHIDDLLFRFQNKSLGDTIYRVGCDLNRKLGPNDRFSGVIKLALEMNLPFNKILDAMKLGCYFQAKDENGNRLKSDIDFNDKWKNNFKDILINISKFQETRINKRLFDYTELKFRSKLSC